MPTEPLPQSLRPGAKRAFTRTITDDDIARFAVVSGDRGRHHVERDAAGKLMAHGLLTATLPTKIGGELHYMARRMEFEFLAPVHGGDTLTCEGVVKSCVAQSTRYKIAFTFEIRNQDGVVVLRGATAGQILR